MTPLIAAAFLSWGLFVAWYWVRARWWASPEGRNVMGVALLIAAVLGLILAQRIWPGYTLRPYAQVVVYTALTALAVQRTVQMERAQRRGRRRD